MASSDSIAQLVEHQFRRSFSDIVALLTHRLGFSHVGLAEDAAQEALIRAMQTWPHSGIPENPSGWLYKVAYRIVLDTVRSADWRKRQGGDPEETLRKAQCVDEPQGDMQIHDLQDDRLRMLFACCHPDIGERNRLSLTLRLVCGLSTNEIAALMLSRRAAVQQQIVRAKRELRNLKDQFELPPAADLVERRDSVLKTLYLLFTAGYAAPLGERAVREDLSREALRCAELLASHRDIQDPTVHALAALFAFQLARFPARLDPDGLPVLLENQDRRLWSKPLIQRGLYHQQKAISGERLTTWHVEAAIAMEHCISEDFDQTDWPLILRHYDDLLSLTDSPVAQLNRCVALYFVEGAASAVKELVFLEEQNALRNYYALYTFKARLLRDLKQLEAADGALRKAKALCTNQAAATWIDGWLAS